MQNYQDQDKVCIEWHLASDTYQPIPSLYQNVTLDMWATGEDKSKLHFGKFVSWVKTTKYLGFVTI